MADEDFVDERQTDEHFLVPVLLHSPEVEEEEKEEEEDEEEEKWIWKEAPGGPIHSTVWLTLPIGSFRGKPMLEAAVCLVARIVERGVRVPVDIGTVLEERLRECGEWSPSVLTLGVRALKVSASSRTAQPLFVLWRMQDNRKKGKRGNQEISHPELHDPLLVVQSADQDGVALVQLDDRPKPNLFREKKEDEGEVDATDDDGINNDDIFALSLRASLERGEIPASEFCSLMNMLIRVGFYGAASGDDDEEGGSGGGGGEGSIMISRQPHMYGGVAITRVGLGHRDLELRVDPPVHTLGTWSLHVVHPAVDDEGKLRDIYRRRRVERVRADALALSIFASDAFVSYFGVAAGAGEGWREIVLRQDFVLSAPTWEDGAPVALKRFVADGGVMILMAPCGCGKTKAVEEMFISCFLRPFFSSSSSSSVSSPTRRRRDTFAKGPPRLLHFAARELLVHDLARRWRALLSAVGLPGVNAQQSVVTCYDLIDAPELLEHALVIVSTRDSLCRIAECCPTVVFVDEMQTIRKEFLSVLMKDRMDSVLEVFERMCLEATHVMFGDAYVNGADIALVQDLHELRKWAGDGVNDVAPLLLRVRPIKPRRHIIFALNEFEFYKSVLADGYAAYREQPAGQREPVVVVCQTVVDVEQMASWLLNQGFPEDGLVAYTRASKLDVHDRFSIESGHVDALLPQLAIYIHSPVVGPGMDFQRPVRRVYGSLAVAGLGGSSSFLQLLYRTRNVRDSNILVNVSPSCSTLISSFDMNAFVARDKEQVRLAFWDRALQHSAVWGSIASNALRTPKYRIGPRDMLDAKLSPPDQLLYNLLCESDAERFREEKTMGCNMLSYIAASGDTFAVTWMIPDNMKQTAAGGIMLPGLDAVRTLAIDALQTRMRLVLPQSVRLQERLKQMRVLVEESEEVERADSPMRERRTWLQRIAHSSADDWLEQVLELKELVIRSSTASSLSLSSADDAAAEGEAPAEVSEGRGEGDGTGEERSVVFDIVQRMVLFGVTNELDAVVMEGENVGRYVEVRNALLGIDPLHPNEERALRYHFDMSRAEDAASLPSRGERDAVLRPLRSLDMTEGRGEGAHSKAVCHVRRQCLLALLRVMGYDSWRDVLADGGQRTSSLAEVTERMQRDEWFKKHFDEFRLQYQIRGLKRLARNFIGVKAMLSGTVLTGLPVHIDKETEMVSFKHKKTLTVLERVRRFADFHRLPLASASTAADTEVMLLLEEEEGE